MIAIELKNWLETSLPSSLRNQACVCSCTTLSLSYCNRFNVRFSIGSRTYFPKASAKLQPFSSSSKFSKTFNKYLTLQKHPENTPTTPTTPTLNKLHPATKNTPRNEQFHHFWNTPRIPHKSRLRKISQTPASPRPTASPPPYPIPAGTNAKTQKKGRISRHGPLTIYNLITKISRRVDKQPFDTAKLTNHNEICKYSNYSANGWYRHQILRILN